MDRDMQVDSDTEKDTVSSNFVFSRPNIIPSPEKVINFGSYSDNIFGGRSNQLPDTSVFTFAKPATIERLDHGDARNIIGKNQKSNPFLTQDTKKIDHPFETKAAAKTKENNKSIKTTPFPAQEIKKPSAFSRLDRTSKRNSTDRLEISNSITCSEVPDSLLVKSVAKEYFEQFGETLKITIRPKRKIITVYYTTKDGATTAFQKSGSFLGHEFTSEWTTSEMLLKPKKKESIKGKIVSILNLDDDVKEELEAMRGLEYNLPDPQNLKALTVAAKAKIKKAKVVANKEIPKRILKPLIPPVKQVSKIVPSIKEVPVVNQNLKKISIATIEELQSQVRQIGVTSEEKYKILDARDRLMRLKQGKPQNLATAKVTKGTCPDMCPEKERYMREFQRQLASYEQIDNADYKINHAIAVKQYSRSSADQEEPMAHDLRPVKSLNMTMSYLLHEIADLCENEDANLTEWYHFLWDRMRSIRKDITQQELCCTETVKFIEQCARFHILSSERLCAEETSVFDPKINSENLTKCLQTLKYMYYDLKEQGIFCKNEPEFRAYIILLNLNNGTFISELSTLPQAVQHSPEVKFALDVYSAIAMDNYSRFFKLVRKTTYLNGCIMMRYFNQVRVKALKVMVKAYCRTTGTTEYPLYELIDILGFEDEDEVFEFCSRVGLKCDRESLFIKLSKEKFHVPDNKLEQGRAYNLVLSKRISKGQSIGQCIAGGDWPEKTYENHKPHSSFDAQGYLLPSSINAQDQNLTDPYDFMEDDAQFVSEQKPVKPVNKPLNNFEEKKQIKATAGPNTVDSPFKKPEPVPPIAPVSRPFATMPPSSSPGMFKTPEASPFATSSTSTASVFSKTSSTIFSSSSTSAAMLPPNSPFNMAVSKSIFSGNAGLQTNLFKEPPKPGMLLAKQDTSETDRKVSSSTTSTSISTTVSTTSEIKTTERISAKRRLDEPDGAVEKRSLLEKMHKKQEEIEERLRAEKEKQRRMELVHQLTIKEYTALEREVLAEMCLTICEAELERAQLVDTLSSQIYEGLVRELCEVVLDEQLFIQDMLIEVERRLRDRLLLKYCRAWKQWAARRRAQRREALDNTPVWLQPESLEERAKKLYHPEQTVAIRYAIEQKKKKHEEQEQKPKYTPIEFIINVGLKENAKSLDVEPSQFTFWKMVMSWPILENNLTLWRHKKLINRYLSPDDYTLEPILIQHRPNLQESLVLCIRHFEGLICETNLVGMDGLLVMVGADEDVRSVERRLSESVLLREKLMPMPLVLLVFGANQREPSPLEAALRPTLERLLESGHLAEYTVLRERESDEVAIVKLVQSAILWLAVTRSPAVPLEMDYLKRVLDDCVTEELWLRIEGHLSHNPQFSKVMDDPNFIINLHNEAVNHITDIILDPESIMYTDFAPELKIYLPNKRTYPCTYEYFDNIWKHPEYRSELERIMNTFIFPQWKSNWPIHDMFEMHDALVDYCSQLVGHEDSLLIADNVMSDLFLIPSENDDSYPCFSNVLLHVMAKKIADLGGNTRVVYNRNHIKHFQTLPWWYKSSVLLDYVAQQEEDTESVSESESSLNLSQLREVDSSSTQIDLELDYDLDELSETYKQQDEELPLSDLCRETRSRAADMRGVTEKLDKLLEEQRLRNQSLEERLCKALQGDSS